MLIEKRDTRSESVNSASRMREREIIQQLTECAKLLRRFQIHGWTEEFERATSDMNRAYAADDLTFKLRTLTNLRNLYGGMGSFNDIFICIENNAIIKADQVTTVNAELQQMQSALYDSVVAEIQDLERENT
jgi:hypothetical protein